MQESFSDPTPVSTNGSLMPKAVVSSKSHGWEKQQDLNIACLSLSKTAEPAKSKEGEPEGQWAAPNVDVINNPPAQVNCSIY